MSDDPASSEAFKWEQRMAQIQRLRTPLEGVDYTVNADRNTAALTICNLMLDAKELNEEIVQLRQQVADLRGERDEARRRMNSILTEIDCRIEHGAESNGHLEAIRSLFKEDTDE